jgi:hypothetical protein
MRRLPVRENCSSPVETFAACPSPAQVGGFYNMKVAAENKSAARPPKKPLATTARWFQRALRFIASGSP